MEIIENVFEDILKKHYDEVECLEYEHYGMPVFKCDGYEYAVGTDDMADKALVESIESSLWAFSREFLSSMTDIPIEVFEALANLYEDSNDTIKYLIESTCGMEEFVNSAESADGRGHFLASYDGNENEIYDEETDETIYLYKI